MIFKFTAVIKLLDDGNYELYFPAIRGIRIRGFSIPEILEEGERALRGYLEERMGLGEDIPRDIKFLPINTEESDEIIITKIVVFIDEGGTLTA
jgi:hypothetical protein